MSQDASSVTTVMVWPFERRMVWPQHGRTSELDPLSGEGKYSTIEEFRIAGQKILLEVLILHLAPKVYLSKIVTSSTKTVCLLSRCGRIFSWGKDSGHPTNPKQPTAIPSLVTENIIDVAAGKSHFLCLSETGKVFTWGQGSCCLGKGEAISALTVPDIVELPEPISAIAATSENSFAVKGRDCYVWGSNGPLLGKDTQDGSSIPLQLQMPGPVTSIQGGSNHVGATIGKDLYMWGSNCSGECNPHDETVELCVPSLISLQFELLSLQLGESFTLATSIEGNIFGWGENDSGQLGLGHTMVARGINLIAQHPSSSQVTAIAGMMRGATCEKGKLSSWGKQDNYDQLPTKTVEFSWLESLTPQEFSLSLVHFSLHDLSLSVLTLEASKYPNYDESERGVLLNLEGLIDNPTFCDITIVAEGKNILVSKILLSARSKYFTALFASQMTEAETGVIKIEDFSYSAVLEMVRYLMCGKCYFTEENSLEILEIGVKYDLKELTQLSEIYLENNLSLQNAFEVLRVADRLSTQTIREAAIMYLFENWQRASKSPQMAELPLTLLLELISRSASDFSDVPHKKMRLA